MQRMKIERCHAQMMMLMHGAGPPPGGQPSAGAGRPNPAYTIVQLDRDYINRTLLPDLTHRYFDTPEGRQYEVAIIAPEDGQMIYRSDGGSGRFHADLRLPIFSVRALRREPFDAPIPQERPRQAPV
jgi:hypothetical protein